MAINNVECINNACNNKNADDILIYTSSKNVELAREIIQDALNFTAIYMEINPLKTYAFSNNKKKR